MPSSNLKNLFEDYFYASNSYEASVIINSIIDEISRHGFDNDSINYFSKNLEPNQKQEFIIKILAELKTSDKIRRFQIIDVLSSFLIETNRLIQESLLPIYFNVIAEEKKNFNLVFTTLKIFTSRWDDFNDDVKKKIFQQFLVILDNRIDFFIEEGVFELTKILIGSHSSNNPTQLLFNEQEIAEYLKTLVRIGLKSKGDALYAAIESILQILEHFPNLVQANIYEDLISINKKLNKKISIFYPSKRKFIKICLSFINLILLFEKNFGNDEYVKNLKELIEKMNSKIDHADVKYYLELILYIIEKTDLPKIEVIKPSIEIIKSLHNKSDRLDDYTKELINSIINAMWPIMSDKEKDDFFKDIDMNKTIV